jgi:hypothetical protein
MSDTVVVLWVAFIFLAALSLSSISLVQLCQNEKPAAKDIFLSLSPGLIAVVLCLSVGPAIHRVYDDEYTYISQSLNILSSLKANIIVKGSRLQPEFFLGWMVFTKFPGFAWLEAVVMFLSRDFRHSYFVLNFILGTLSVVLVYRIAWVWTADRAAAWWAAVFLACLPARIVYSMSAASDVTGLFFFLAFLFFISEYRTRQSKVILYAALFCGIYCICIRVIDGIFVILSWGAALYMYQRKGWLDRKTFLQLWQDTACLLLPILTGVIFMYLRYPQPVTFSLSYLLGNLHTSVQYLFGYEQNTFLTALAALAAIGRSLFYKKDDLVNALALWFLAGLLIISAFYAGGLRYPGEAYSDRYILFFVFPLLLLAAKGVVEIATIFGRRFLWSALFIILTVNAFFASGHLNEMGHRDDYYQKTLLLKKMSDVIPAAAYVIHESAALVTAETPWKSVQTDAFLDGDHPGQVVFLKGVQDLTVPIRTAQVEAVLKHDYLCRPLVTTPFKEAGLSATPLLCILSSSHGTPAHTAGSGEGHHR